jgi:predicted nucleic acid-binding protein
LYVYIDSDVIVASEIKSETHHAESKMFMERVLGDERRGVTYLVSVFTFLELASAMIRRTHNKDRAYSLLYRIRTSWKRSIKPVSPLESKKLASFPTLIDTLIETSIRFRTPSADTIHAQTIYRYGCDYLVTWNKRHFAGLRHSMKKVKILNPKEMLLEWQRM